MLQQLLLGDRCARLQLNVGDRHLAGVGVRTSDRRNQGDARMARQRLLDCPGIDIVSSPNDQLLLAPGQPEITIGVASAEIPGIEPALAVDVDPDAGVMAGVEIAFEDIGPADRDDACRRSGGRAPPRSPFPRPPMRPTLYAALSQTPVGDSDISSLRFAICGAAPMPAALIRAFEVKTGVKISRGLRPHGRRLRFVSQSGRRRMVLGTLKMIGSDAMTMHGVMERILALQAERAKLARRPRPVTAYRARTAV